MLERRGQRRWRRRSGGTSVDGRRAVARVSGRHVPGRPVRDSRVRRIAVQNQRVAHNDDGRGRAVQLCAHRRARHCDCPADRGQKQHAVHQLPGDQTYAGGRTAATPWTTRQRRPRRRRQITATGHHRAAGPQTLVDHRAGVEWRVRRVRRGPHGGCTYGRGADHVRGHIGVPPPDRLHGR